MIIVQLVETPDEIDFAGSCFEKAICEIEKRESIQEKIEESIQNIRKWSQESHTHFTVARYNNTLAGFNSLWIKKDENQEEYGKICLLYVLPEFRGKRISSILKKEGEEWLKKRGVNKIKTEIDFRNQKMIDINLQKGFTIKTIIMEKDI